MDLFREAIFEAIGLVARADPALLRITGLSLAVSCTATLLAALAGIPLAAALHLGRFRGKRVITLLVRTGMGLPPVVVGLVVMMLLWRSGPFGALQLLYTPPAMVIAQFLVACPIIAGVAQAGLGLLDAELVDALRADGADEWRTGLELLRAASAQVVVAIAAGFGRALSEVGASLMVGGNILGQTRILTTAITLEAGKGEFALALALGFVLLAMALLVNVLLGGLARSPSAAAR